MFDNDIMNITSDDYDSIKYIVNSELRMSILKLLYDGDASFDDIKRSVHKQDSNISRTLKELQDVKLVQKNHKYFRLSSSGYLLVRNMNVVFDNFYVLNKLKKCWNRHQLDNLPLYFARFLFLWKDGVFVNSNYVEYYKNIDTYKEKIVDSCDIKVVLPIYSKFHIDSILNAVASNNGVLELVTSRDILDAVKNSSCGELFEKLRSSSQVQLWISDDNCHKIFYTICDNFASLTLFYLDDSYDDSAMIFNENMVNHDLFVNLFDDYKSNFRKL